MLTPNITTYYHDFGLVSKIPKSVVQLETETIAATELPPLGHLCTGEIGLFIQRKGEGKKAPDFLQQAFCSNVLYHPGSNGDLCQVSERVLVMHRTLYLTSHITGQFYQTGDISTVEPLFVFLGVISYFYFLPSSLKSHEINSSSPISLSSLWGLDPQDDFLRC